MEYVNWATNEYPDSDNFFPISGIIIIPLSEFYRSLCFHSHF